MKAQERMISRAARVVIVAAMLPATASAGSQPQAESSAQEKWEQMREQTISASELMDADVGHGVDAIGNVRDLVLNEQSSAVQFVLYEIPYPYNLYGADDGFAAYENVSVESAGTFGLEIRVDEPESAQASERLTLTRQEADSRLLSNIVGETVRFAGDESRRVEDVLIDRDSGEIRGYVVNGNPDALFNDDPRLVEAGSVKIDGEGELSASTEFAALEAIE